MCLQATWNAFKLVILLIVVMVLLTVIKLQNRISWRTFKNGEYEVQRAPLYTFSVIVRCFVSFSFMGEIFFAALHLYLSTAGFLCY